MEVDLNDFYPASNLPRLYRERVPHAATPWSFTVLASALSGDGLSGFLVAASAQRLDLHRLGEGLRQQLHVEAHRVVQPQGDVLPGAASPGAPAR